MRDAVSSELVLEWVSTALRCAGNIFYAGSSILLMGLAATYDGVDLLAFAC